MKTTVDVFSFVAHLRTFSLFILAALTFEATNAFAQGWEQTYGDGIINSGFSLQKTTDGGFVLVGHTYASEDEYADVLLIKTDENGMEEWSQTFGSPYAEDYGKSVQQTSDGGFIITGITHLEGEDSEDGGLDVLLIKTYPNGVIEWGQTLGGTLNDVGWSVCQTSDGGYAITGYTVTSLWDVEGHFKEVYLIKTDANGNEEWSQTFGAEEMTAIGYSLEQTDDGGFIIGGRIGPGRKIQNNTSSDAYLIKTDESGAELWSQTYGGDYFDTGYSVQQTSDGGFILSGFMTGSNDVDLDVYLVKTDGIGTEEWSQTFGNADTQDHGRSVQQTSDGGYIIGGTRDHLPGSTGDSDMILIKTTGNGSEEWTQTFEGEAESEDLGYSVQQTEAGCYIFLGATSNEGASDAYLIKTCAETPQSASFFTPTSGGRKLEKVVDILGREVNRTPNQIQLYIYDDGTVEQKVVRD